MKESKYKKINRSKVNVSAIVPYIYINSIYVLAFLNKNNKIYWKLSMEQEKISSGKWNFGPNNTLASVGNLPIRAVLGKVIEKVDKTNGKKAIALGNGDPTNFPIFKTTDVAVEAVVSAVKSGVYNGYVSNSGLASARIALADHINKDLPYKISQDNIYLTSGATQAIEVMLSVLARPGANILYPIPGFPLYEARACFSNLEVRHFNLIPEKGWEVDLDQVEALADENTAAIVIINPGNPCGNVYSYEHLAKIAMMAKKLGIMVIADEVYNHLTYGNNPFVPMGAFGDTVPVVTLGSLSKRWVVPGWRLGWIALADPNGILKQTKVVEGIQSFLNISTDPATFIQASIPHILKNTSDDFFSNIINLLKKSADLCYEKLDEIDCITCPYKPEGSMFIMAKLNLAYLDGITDCVDFCCRLAQEESVIVLPGTTVGLKNWLRITFAIDSFSLELALDRMKSFCARHAKNN